MFTAFTMNCLSSWLDILTSRCDELVWTVVCSGSTASIPLPRATDRATMGTGTDVCR